MSRDQLIGPLHDMNTWRVNPPCPGNLVGVSNAVLLATVYDSVVCHAQAA